MASGNDTDGEVVAAARGLIEELGGAALTMDALARRAGVSRATLYRRFTDKAGLVEHLRAAGIELDERSSTRSRILAAVHQRVGVEGKLGVTIEELASLAGVSAMSIHRLFGDRQSLLAAFLEQVGPGQAAHAALDEGASLLDTLATVARRTLTFAMDNPGLALTALAGTASEHLDELRGSARSTREHLTRYFEAASARGELVDEAPRLLVAYWIAMVLAEPVFLRQLARPCESDPAPSFDLERSAQRIAQAFVRAFGADPSRPSPSPHGTP